MTDFSHLSKLQIETDKTITYDLEDLVGQPSLQVLPATEGNKEYFNAALKSQRKNRTSNKNIDAAFIQKGRAKDKELYPKYIIKGWSGILDTQGNAVEFSVENAIEFIRALPDYLFDDLRDFCQNPKNFTNVEDEEVVEEIIKN